MPNYSEQDLKYAAEFREEIHREALAIVRKTRPNISEVIDRHPVEDYFQENWEYPGKWYTVVAIPYGYKSRMALVDTIVRDTLSGSAAEKVHTDTKELKNTGNIKPVLTHRLTAEPDKTPKQEDTFSSLIAGYTDLVLDYFIVEDERYCGYISHRKALKTAFAELCGEWSGNPNLAVGRVVSVSELFSPKRESEKLNYRKAFLSPPHGNSYTDNDFDRINTALFPNGTDGLDVYEWTTDWSDYFDEGHEWWGTLCLTVYDKTLSRFAVIMASATD